jgi:hypothetical protein
MDTTTTTSANPVNTDATAITTQQENEMLNLKHSIIEWRRLKDENQELKEQVKEQVKE